VSNASKFKAPLIPEVVHEHLEQLQSLLESYASALRSPEYTAPDLADLKEPVEAHVDALVIAGERIRPLLEEGLAGKERMPVFSAAYVLLRSDQSGAAERVAEALGGAQGEQLDGLRDALCQSPIATILPQLQEALTSGSPAVALAAAHVLAFDGKLDRNAASRWEDLLHHETPEVRKAAWRVATIVDSLESRR
jgi:hypothetical protein